MPFNPKFDHKTENNSKESAETQKVKASFDSKPTIKFGLSSKPIVNPQPEEEAVSSVQLLTHV